MSPTPIEILGTVLFALAVIHTFVANKILHFSHRFPKDSVWYHLFHLLGEIEVVFAIWASALMVGYVALNGWGEAIKYQQSLLFVEPFFVFAIMVICATRPILTFARNSILNLSLGIQKIFRTPAVMTDLAVLMFFGSLSGSFITEPAAMTVTAFMLNSMLKSEDMKLNYFVLAVLFVNISIGGALTPFAAPPILMVASKWNWDFAYIISHFGWRSTIAVAINTALLIVLFRHKLKDSFYTLQEVNQRLNSAHHNDIPMGVTLVHLFFLVMVVITGHYQNAFLGIFLLFLGVVTATQRYQDSLRLKESLLVGLFLGGIIQFGAFQRWWLEPAIGAMSDMVLFKGAVVLTAVTDNAALTYLGSQVEGLSDASRYALVAGALAGGGLTIIANAPNAAGYSILSNKFPKGVNPLHLLLAALLPTAVAIVCLGYL